MGNQQEYKIILINDQLIFRKELKHRLEKKLGLNIIVKTNSCKELLRLTSIMKSDIVHMDVILPENDKMDAVKVITDQLVKHLSKYNGKHICLKVR